MTVNNPVSLKKFHQHLADFRNNEHFVTGLLCSCLGPTQACDEMVRELATREQGQ